MARLVISMRAPPSRPARRAGVLLLVVLSMLTLFMLLGVTYLVLASRVRATSRAFLKLADDQAKESITLAPMLKEAALQVIRGTQNANSAIRGHDLLADKYNGSTSYALNQNAASLVAGGQMIAIQLPSADPTFAAQVVGRVLTFVDGPASIVNRSVRIVHAEGAAPCTAYVARPPQLAPGDNVALITRVLVNGRDFQGKGFTSNNLSGTGTTSLDNSALLANPAYGALQGQPNEDYDAVDEQNWALATADGQLEKSFQRQAVINYWINWINNSPGAPSPLNLAIEESGTPSASPSATLLPLRKATLRPFAFDHWQDTPGGTDFAGRSLSNFNVIANNPGDVDNDGDGRLDSIWLDLGQSVIQLRDGTTVKPLFAIHCTDLDGRININAHGSPAHLAQSSVVGDSRLAPNRGANGASRQAPTSLRGGLGFGPADVRLDSVLSADDVAAVMVGSAAASGVDDGIRRDLPPVVGRYGDGVASAANPAFPGQPGVNDRRSTNPAALWTDRGLPEQYWQANGTASLFAGNPPDFWSRLSVGIDHRGNPLYLARNTQGSSSEATDNPYEFDLSKPKPGDAYVGAAASWVDQPFTAAELEAVVRSFDIDNAAALPPRALSFALSGTGGQLDLNRVAMTTESWDTPAVVSTDLAGSFAATADDPDLVAGLKMDINRPFGDGTDNDSNGLVDEPGEQGDAYSASYTDANGGVGWLVTRGWPSGIPAQPGPNEPHLRSRQLFAYQIYNLLKVLKSSFALSSTAEALRLFAVSSDVDTNADPPVAADSSLNSGSNGDRTLQNAHNEKVLAQWAVNVVDFLDPDAIMTPFRYQAGSAALNVVWGCEFPDLMITETLAFHDRRTADTKCDPTKETTVDFRNQYESKYNTWMAWKNGGRIGPEPPYPQPKNADGAPNPDDLDFDQVRIPEGSLFIELYGTRSPNVPNLPRELYSYANGGWYLDLGRTPTANSPPVWRLSLSTNRTASPGNDVFQQIKSQPDTTSLTPGTNRNQIADTIDIDRYVWLSTVGSSNAALPAAPVGGANGPNRDNTFYVRQASGLANPRLSPGGYLVVGPRPDTAVGSIKDGVGSQKWGYPSKQRIALQSAGSGNAPAVGVYDLTGLANPTVAKPNNAPFGNPLPPPDDRTETSAVWVAMDPPTAGGWASWNQQWDGVGTSGIGLNVSEPLRNGYYQCPTHKNPANNLYEAYGALDNDTHTDFLPTPLDQSGPLAAKMLSGGTYANFCTVFVERLADPTRPFNPDAASADWNPYVVIDFMPIDLTVVNGESATSDPSETQGPDRGLGPAQIPYAGPFPASPADPLPPTNVPLPIGSKTQLAKRQTYFHTRQRGFGKDLPNYDNDQTLFGTGGGTVYRNLHPFKPIGSTDDIQDTPLATAGAGTTILPGGKATTPRSTSGLSANEIAYFLHELGQSPDGRAVPSDWASVPYQSLGWVNPSFGRRLDTGDGIPAAYAGAPDRPFPWIVWNDRPFANPYELLFVPRTPPGRLFTNYRNLDYPQGTAPAPTPYPNVTNGTYNSGDLFGACTPGAHLLPITSITDVPASGATRTRNADFFVRLFEYVRVRSPFTGTETVLTGTAPISRFVGPFNRLSTYREPGRINLNTIPPSTSAGSGVWNALCGVESGNATPAYSDILQSLASGTGGRAITVASGTSYVRPYRIARGIRTDFSSPARGYANTFLPQAWVSGSTGDLFSPRAFTLFADRAAAHGTSIFAPPAADAAANDGQRNAWFRFESMVRANANATVRSEVYAIWVTMGLFEVQSVGVTNSRYPDGYKLVREYGSASGEVARHRGFYIFDRSIPVGCSSGDDLNVQDAILVERFIE